MTYRPAGELAPSSIQYLFVVAVAATVKRERGRETEERRMGEARTNGAQDIFRSVVSWHAHSTLSPQSL